MVAHTRAPAGPHRLRPLREPRPIEVESDGEGRPVAVMLNDRRLAVVVVQDTWRIDDEWWRQRPVSRLYYELALEDGQLVTVYRDLAHNSWCHQHA